MRHKWLTAASVVLCRTRAAARGGGRVAHCELLVHPGRHDGRDRDLFHAVLPRRGQHATGGALSPAFQLAVRLAAPRRCCIVWAVLGLMGTL